MLTWTHLIDFSTLLLSVVAAAGGTVAVVEMLKGWLNLTNGSAKIASWVLTGLLATLNAVVAGQIQPELFTDPVSAVLTIAAIFLGVAKVSAGTYDMYRRVRSK